MRSRLAAASCLLCLALPASAASSVSPAELIDGPSPDIVGFDGVAMSEDGTGGIVYRKLAGGRPHVFAAQYTGARWRPAQRVDVGQRFDSSWPAIGAADDGRLVVTWVQENGPESDRLFSATLASGSSRFGPPVPIDLNVGEATDTQPSLAMSRGGQAYLVYRVTKDPARNPTLPPGTVEGEYRLARYTGEYWSPLGFPINRNPSAPVTAPSPDNPPQVGIDALGNGVVAWVERDDEFIDRVWARRLFGSQLSVPLLVSPRTAGGAPLRAPADSPDLDVAGFGQAAVAFRQHPARAAGAVRVQLAMLAESFVTEAATFRPAQTIDGAGEAGPPVVPGRPSVATAPGGVFLGAFGLGTSSLLVPGSDKEVGARERIDTGRSDAAGDPQVDLAESGAVALALRTSHGGSQLQLVERRADGVPDSSTVNAPRGGRVGPFELAGSGLGDALAGWQQGTGDLAQIAAAVIDAPPQEFAVQTPADFVRGPRVLRLRWDPAANAGGPVTYTVTIDDEELASDLRRRSHDIRTSRLDDGVTQVQVIARDPRGQETTSVPATIKLDRRAPRVRLAARRGRKLRVEVRDGARGQVAGADHAATQVRWGDGRRAAGREGAFAITHTYRSAGRYRVVVQVTDAAGNRRIVTRHVHVR